jgi:hypothetical protein
MNRYAIYILVMIIVLAILVPESRSLAEKTVAHPPSNVEDDSQPQTDPSPATPQPDKITAVGTPLHTTYITSGCSLPNGTEGIGLAFDGQYLWHSCRTPTFPPSVPDLFKVDPLTGQVLASFTVSLPSSIGFRYPGGLAWDPIRKKLWTLQVGTVWLIDPATGIPTLVFTTGQATYYVALAYDPQDDTLYMNGGSSNQIIYHFSSSGTLLGTWTVGPYLPRGGLAVAGDLLYHTSGDLDYTTLDSIVAHDKVTGSLQFQFNTTSTKIMNDLECDSVTFAPLTALWVLDPADPEQATAYEIPVAVCSSQGIFDLTSTPGDDAKDDVTLTWTAPDGNGSPASAYDLRYSDAPIDETAWDLTTQVQGVPPPASPGNFETLTLSSFANGTRWYFGLKYQDANGKWSALSNVPSLLDLGFRPTTDGYYYKNFSDVFPSDFTFDDMIHFFNSQAAVCYNSTGACNPRSEAKTFQLLVLSKMIAGHCEGMSTTALRFFKGLDNQTTFETNAKYTHDLDLLYSRENISLFHVRQYVDPLGDYKNQQVAMSPSTNLNQLINALTGTAPDPMNLIVRQKDASGQISGHTLTPYAVEERQKDYRVWVYDNNIPDISQTLYITPTIESWNYAPLNYSGNASTQTLGVIPLSETALTSVCPWCSPNGINSTTQQESLQAAGASEAQVWLTGAQHLLITDSQGRRIGYLGDQTINEIPGATDYVGDGGLGIDEEPIYTLPLTDTYSILLDGQTLTQTQNASLVEFGPGYASGAENILVDSATQDQVGIAPDGTLVSYTASASKQITLLLTTDSSSEGYEFRLEGVYLPAGQPVIGTVDPGSGQLAFDNRNGQDGTYNLAITRANTTGQYKFFHPGIPALAGDIHSLDYAGWDGAGDMLLLVDHGGDGTIDATVPLANQNLSLFLPLVEKN